MRLINIEDEPLLKTVSVGGLSAKSLWRLIKSQRTIKAIPIEVFYKMIHNALADTKKENWEPEECPYDYFDGNRNAIHCMLDILCGDKDGDHDKFWEDYSQWEEENETNRCR